MEGFNWSVTVSIWPAGFWHLVCQGVSSFPLAFKQAMEEAGVQSVKFHRKREVRPKYFPRQDVYLLSVKDEFISSWSTILRFESSYSFDMDRTLLRQAQEERRTWEIVYFAKRVMQTNVFDAEAAEAIEEPDMNYFSFRQRNSGADDVEEERVVNPFFKYFTDPEVRVEVIRASQLIERKRNEILCEVADEGDSMFIVLRGEIGIFPKGLHSTSGDKFVSPSLTATVGETVGEIAFALKRRRTATMSAMEDTALLSLNADQIYATLKQHHVGEEIRSSLDKFFKNSVLKFICWRLSYLLGPDGKGPLCEIKNPWEKMSRYSDILEFPWTEKTITRVRDEFQDRGLYILVKGKLRNETGGEILDCAREFPVVFANRVGDIPNPGEGFFHRG